MTGGTRQMAEAAAGGAAAEPTVRVRLLPAPDAEATISSMRKAISSALREFRGHGRTD